MPETFSKISQQATDYWNGFDTKQKMKIGISILLFIAVLGMVIFFSTRPRMVPLFTGLDQKTAAEIQDKLNEMKLTNKATRGGSTIEVREQDKTKAQLALAKENIPKPGFTFEDALNKNGMGTTESQKKETFKYAKQEELSKAIAEIEGIKSASVKLVIPNDDNFFIESKQKASASVKLDVENTLSRDQVLGIVRFVAGSVSGMDLQDVTVIDQNANLLYFGQEDKAMKLNNEYEVEQQKKNDIEKQVKLVLAPLFDDVRVTSSIRLNWNVYSEKNEIYASPIQDSAKGLLTREQVEQSKAENGSEGLEPGLANNGGDVPNYEMGDNQNSKAEVKKHDKTYMINKTESTLEKPVGEIVSEESSLSIYLYNEKIYDQATLQARGELDNTTWEEFKFDVKQQPKAIIVADELIASIKDGTGIQKISLVGYEKPVFIDQVVVQRPLADYIPIIILVVLIALLAYALIKKTEPHEITEIEPELSVEDLLANAQIQQDPLENIEYSAESEVKRQIEKFVDERPEAVAQLLRNWLSEEWEG